MDRFGVKLVAQSHTATVRDVARLAGVSAATVSNVLRNHPRVAAATRDRVRAAAAELGYRPNVHARSLRTGRSGSIALVLPGLRNAYFAEFASEVIRVASRYGLGVSLDVLDAQDVEHEIAVLNGPQTEFVDGLIYYPQLVEDHDIDSAVRPGQAVVLIGERGAGSRHDLVEYQNAAAACAVTRHLLDRGCRRIVAVGPHEKQGSATPRLEGFLAAHREAGVAVDDALVIGSRRWHRGDGADAVSALLAAGIEFDGIFAFNDMLAHGAMRALAEVGRRVPQDVKVAGFDDLEESAFSLPSLTTVDPGKRAAAELAVELLDRRIRGGAGDQRVIATPEFRLVERGSTAPTT